MYNFIIIPYCRRQLIPVLHWWNEGGNCKIRILMIIYCADPLEDNALLSPHIFCQHKIKKMVPIKNKQYHYEKWDITSRHCLISLASQCLKLYDSNKYLSNKNSFIYIKYKIHCTSTVYHNTSQLTTHTHYNIPFQSSPS